MFNGVDLAVRHPGEIAGQAQFVEQPQRAGVHGVAAEVAQEVGVLLHHRDVDAAAGEQQAQHDSRGTAAGDDAGGLLRVVRLGRHSVIFASNSLAGWAASSTGGTASNCGCPASPFVAQTAVVMPVVLALAYGIAILSRRGIGQRDPAAAAGARTRARTRMSGMPRSRVTLVLVILVVLVIVTWLLTR